MKKFCFAWLAAFLSVAFVLVGCNSETKNASVASKNEVSVHSLSDVFEVIDFLPGDELPSEARYPTIQVQFSEPVIALHELGAVVEKSPYLSIEPELKGTYRWFGTSLLSFVSSEEVVPQKMYTVKVAPDIVSASGKQLTGQTEFSFHTEELKISSLIPGFQKFKDGKGTTYYSEYYGVMITQAMDLGVCFNAPVNPDVVGKFLKITDESGKEYSFKAEASDLGDEVKNSKNIIRLTLLDAPKEGEKIKITLPEGSRADEGAYETTEARSEILPTREPFAYESTSEESDYAGCKNYVNLYFNTSLKDGQEEKILSLLSFDKDIKITKENIGINYSSIVLYNLPVDYKESFTLTLKPGVEDDYGRKTTETSVVSVTIPPAKGSVSYKNYRSFAVIEAKYTPRLAFMHRNVKGSGSYTVKGITGLSGKKSSKGSSTVKVNAGEENQYTLETVELSEALEQTDSGAFHGAVRFTSEIPYTTTRYDWESRGNKQVVDTSERDQIIQVTDLGVTVRYGYNQAVVLVTSLETGKPVANASVKAYKSNVSTWETDKVEAFLQNLDSEKDVGSAVTDANGLATISFAEGTLVGMNYSDSLYIRVTTDDDSVVFIPTGHNRWNSSVAEIDSPSAGELESSYAFIFTDRGLYKPGETVTFRVIDRNLKKGAYNPYKGSYTMKLSDPWWWDATVYQTKTGSTTANGTTWGEFKIPEDMKPGEYCLSYSHDGSKEVQRCYVQIQYFEAAKFEVITSINKDKTYYSGDTLSATVTSNYLGGGSMGESTYSSYWTRSPVRFTKEGFGDMSFGPIDGYYDGRTSLDSSKGKLDGTGSAKISQSSGGEKVKGIPYSYTIQTTVTDSGNQAIASSGSVTVHPAKFYIGLSDITNIKGFPKKDTQLKFNYVCITPEGENPAASVLPKDKKLTMELLHEEWEEVNQVAWNGDITTRYSKKLVSDKKQVLNLSGSKKETEISVTPEAGGAYVLRLSTTDAEGNEVISENSFYVTGSDWYWFSRDDATEITLTTDKPEYSVGETAHILMRSPLPKGTYLITIEREGIFDKEIRTINEPTSVLDFQVKENYVPVMYVAVSSFSTRTEEPPSSYSGTDLGKPNSYFGLTAINVNSNTRKFDVQIKMDKDVYTPGSKAKIKVHASTKSGPVKNAEITLMAVDRGVIDLIDYHVSDPLSYFYDRSKFPECVDGGDNRSILIDPVTYTKSSQVGGDEKGTDGDTRKNFNPLALFEPSLITDANGDAECTFTLPDSLTAYRVTAVGATADTFALAENEFNVANKLSVRTALPRQLRLFDKSELGVTVSNLENTEQELSVTAKITSGVQQYDDEVQKLPGLATVEKESTKTLKVPANSTKTLMFNVSADQAGWVTVEFKIQSKILNENIVLPLQIEKPYIYETVTTIGSTDGAEDSESASERIIIPGDADDNMGHVYVQLDPTRLGILREAVDYTFHYPYGCLEQRSSAILPLIAFGDYIKAFGLDNEVKKPRSVVESEIKSWASSQLHDGGFPYWPNGSYSSAYVSSRIAEILGLAQQKGYKISGIDTDALARYLKNHVITYLLTESGSQYSYNLYDAAHELYAASMIAELDGIETLTDRITSSNNLDSATTALCGLIYSNLGNKEKENDVVMKLKRKISLTTQGADLYDVDLGSYWSIYYDASEKYALALQLLSRNNPNDDTIQHIVYELLALQKSGNGYWTSTAATARVLTAFDEYIRANKLEDLNFTAEVLLNQKSVLEGSFKGVGAEPAEATLKFNEQPVSSMPRDKEIALKFSKKGTGKLYYTASMKYAVPTEKQFAREEGLCIFTEITDGETGEIVSENKLVSGRTYKMKAYISSTRNRNYVALKVPVPAGCEIMNAAFVTTGTLPIDSSTGEFGYNMGLSYEGIYNSDVQYFWDYFPRGHQEVEYSFRAVRKGEYNTPSATAECMYQPEIFGRSDGKKWIIE